jgi:hypothetical protein
MQSSGGGGGGGGSASLNVALTDFINDQSSAQKKMMDNFGRLQEAQAMEASQNAAQMTSAMNQVVAREDERLSREEGMQEKMKDREYQERHHEWTAKFQKQAGKDLVAVQTRVASQMAAGRDFIQRMDANRVEFGDRIRGMRQVLHDPNTIEQWTNTPGGMDRLDEMTRQLRLAENFHEQDHQSDYTGQAASMMAQVQEQILAGEPHADLTALARAKPRDVMQGAVTSDWADDEIEELFHTGGYVPGGLYGRDPDDPALAKYKSFNPIDYMSNMWMLEDEQFFAVVTQKKFRDDYLAMRMETFRDMREELGKLQEFSTQDYDRLATTAVEGAYYGAAGFVEEMGSGKVTPQTLTKSLVLKSGEFGAPDIRHAMATRLVESSFTAIAGPGSDVILRDLDSLLSGEGDKGVLDTDVELYKAFNMRNVLRHIDDQLLSMTQAPKDGEPMSMALAKQIANSPDSSEKRELIRALTMVPGDIERGYRMEATEYKFGMPSPAALGQIHRGVNRLFRLAKQKVMELRDLVEAQPAMQGYQMQQGSSARYVDALVSSYLSDKPDADQQDEAVRQRAMRGAKAADYQTAFEQIEGEQEGFDLEAETLREAIKLSPFQAAGKLYSGFTSRPEFLAALYSGDYDLAPTVMPPVSASNLGESQLALEDYIGKSQRRRGRVQAEMKRRREEYAKKNPPLGEMGTEAPVPGGPSRDEPNQP